MEQTNRILFRAKKLSDNKWVYGYYYHRAEVTEEGIINQHIIMEQNKHCQIVSHQVNPDTVGQYTDKNIGKKLIYEGDILLSGNKKASKHEREYKLRGIGLVKWSSRECAFVLCWWDAQGGSYEPQLVHMYEYDTIIGNIHDNPKLLEDK